MNRLLWPVAVHIHEPDKAAGDWGGGKHHHRIMVCTLQCQPLPKAWELIGFSTYKMELMMS